MTWVPLLSLVTVNGAVEVVHPVAASLPDPDWRHFSTAVGVPLVAGGPLASIATVPVVRSSGEAVGVFSASGP